jgi:hypothetical protein
VYAWKCSIFAHVPFITGKHEQSDIATIAFQYSYNTGMGIVGDGTYLTPLSSSYAPRVAPETTTTANTAITQVTTTTTSNTLYEAKYFYDDSTAYLIPALNVVYSVSLNVVFDLALCLATGSLVTTWYVFFYISFIFNTD